MAIPYTGDPTNNPSSITLPDDGDDMDASSINTAFEPIIDKLAFLSAGKTMRSKTITADGTWTAPANVGPFLVLVGHGGGAGGAAGGNGSTTASDQAVSGAGGGGSIQSVQVVAATASETYTIDVGAGGAADTDGSDTTFSDHVPTVLARFKGAGKGFSSNLAVAATPYGMSRGGAPVANAWLATALAGTNFVLSASPYAMAPAMNTVPSGGGAGVSSIVANGVRAPDGNASPQGYAGGTGGASGIDASTRIGGAGGGGGGGGPGGAGGNGGAGGAGNATTGGNGTAGSAAAANTGAGGGGGGAGGDAGTTPGTGAAGAAGGSGKLTIYYWGDST